MPKGCNPMPPKKSVIPDRNPQTAALVDVLIDAPEGFVPSQLRLRLDKRAVNYAEKYAIALMQARGIPHNQTSISIADPVSIAFLQQGYTAQNAINAAISTYQRLQNECDQESWFLALLSDNVLLNEPEPYEAEDGPPGIFVLEATRNLSIPVERRLKQLTDYLGNDFEFSQTIMTAVNDAIAKAVNLAETDEVGFRSSAAGRDLSGKAQPVHQPVEA